MTYFGFLVRFLIIPIFILGVVTIYDYRRGKTINKNLHATPVWLAIVLHMFIALAYTSLWDNYLVATRVWWYEPDLVTGITIGYVPIEEYTFFILQPLLAGLWLLFILRRLSFPEQVTPLKSNNRWIPLGVVAALWLLSIFLLISRRTNFTYFSLEMVWALPPIGLQLAFGGDILKRYWKPVLLTILPFTLYLSAMDALAIYSGTWTINPAKSLDLLIAGILPIEEFLFFLLTNTLVTFGMVLFLAKESWDRFGSITKRFKEFRSFKTRSIEK